jgi:hypothetical protein
MKKSDIAMIILIAAASSLIAYFVASSFISVGGQNHSQKVKTIDAIDSSIVEPSTDVFNKDAINPTVAVPIGSDTAKQ